MPTYNINHTDINKDPKVVEEGSVNEHELDIALIGRIRLEYGERINQNLLNLLENFSADSDPSLVPSTPTPMPTTSTTPSGFPVSQTPTPTVTRTPTRTVSITPSITPSSGLASPTPTITITPTIGVTPTPTPTPSFVITTINFLDIPTYIHGVRGILPSIANAKLSFLADGTFAVAEHIGPDNGLIGNWTSGVGTDYELFYTYNEDDAVGGPFGGLSVTPVSTWSAFPVVFYAVDNSNVTEHVYNITVTIRKISNHADTQTFIFTLLADGG